MSAKAVLRGGNVLGLDRCPHCRVATPLITKTYKEVLHKVDQFNDQWWHFVGTCSRCSRQILFYGFIPTNKMIRGQDTPPYIEVYFSYPSVEQAPSELPERARKFLQQALDSLHAPDGAVMLAASSIDSMLKDKGYKDGSLFDRIEAATASGLLTTEMKAWAHEIRLSANEPRHADDDFDGFTPADAEQTVEFAKALCEYLYVLPSRVQRWKSKA